MGGYTEPSSEEEGRWPQKTRGTRGRGGGAGLGGGGRSGCGAGDWAGTTCPWTDALCTEELVFIRFSFLSWVGLGTGWTLCTYNFFFFLPVQSLYFYKS